MLKHASPLRSSSRLSNGSSSTRDSAKNSDRSSDSGSIKQMTTSTTHADDQTEQSHSHIPKEEKYNEKEVDCEGIQPPVVKKPLSVTEVNSWSNKLLSIGGNGKGIGPVITHGRAIVRRGLSFNIKRDPDTVSLRSVRSEGKDSDSSISNSPTKKSASLSGLLNEESSCFEYNLQGMRMRIGIAKEDPPSLKNLLKLPGVFAHVQIPENSNSKSPPLLCPETMSLTSADSFISTNSGRTSSRSWTSNMSSNSNTTSGSSNSNSSSSEPTSTTIRVFAKCLRPDIEYKTLSVSARTTCKDLVALLLSKYRMRHRDPNLFYLTMEVTVRRWSGVPVRSLLVLEESAKPAQLALCRPPGDSRFALQKRRGGIVKVHDTVLFPGSQYKSLLVSYRTTTDEAVQLLLNCYNRKESRHYYALHQVCRSPQYRDRRLQPDERVLELKAQWPRDRQAEFVFVLRRNMTQAFSLRRQLSMRTSGEINRAVEEEKKKEPQVQQTKAVPETALIDCTDVTPLITKVSLSSANMFFSRCPKDNVKSNSHMSESESSNSSCSDNVKKRTDTSKIEKTVSFVDSQESTFSNALVPYSATDIIRYTNKINILNNINKTKKAITQPVSILKPPKPKFETMSKLPSVMESILLMDNSAQTDLSYNINMKTIRNPIINTHSNTKYENVPSIQNMTTVQQLNSQSKDAHTEYEFGQYFIEDKQVFNKSPQYIMNESNKCLKTCITSQNNPVNVYHQESNFFQQNCQCKSCFYI